MERKILCVRQGLNSDRIANDAFHFELLAGDVLLQFQCATWSKSETFRDKDKSARFTSFEGKGKVTLYQGAQAVHELDFRFDSASDEWTRGRFQMCRTWSFGPKVLNFYLEGRGIRLSRHPTEDFVRAYAKALRKDSSTPPPRIPALYLPKFLVVEVIDMEERKEAPS